PLCSPSTTLFRSGRKKLQPPDTIYRQSETLWRRGEVQEAIEVADRAWRRWRNEPASEWHWKFRLLEAELLLNQGSAARALALLESPGSSPPSEELSARYLANLGHAKKDVAMVNQAFELAMRQGNRSIVAAIELKRANLDRYESRSEAYIRNALAQARAQSDAYLEAAALLDFGYQRLHMGRFDEAIPWLE